MRQPSNIGHSDLTHVMAVIILSWIARRIVWVECILRWQTEDGDKIELEDKCSSTNRVTIRSICFYIKFKFVCRSVISLKSGFPEKRANHSMRIRRRGETFRQSYKWTYCTWEKYIGDEAHANAFYFNFLIHLFSYEARQNSERMTKSYQFREFLKT